MCLENAEQVGVKRPSVEEPGVVRDDPVNPGEVHAVIHEVEHRVNTCLAATNDQVVLRCVSNASKSFNIVLCCYFYFLLFHSSNIPFIGIKFTPGATLKPGGEVAGTIVSQHVASTSFFRYFICDTD